MGKEACSTWMPRKEGLAVTVNRKISNHKLCGIILVFYESNLKNTFYNKNLSCSSYLVLKSALIYYLLKLCVKEWDAYYWQETGKCFEQESRNYFDAFNIKKSFLILRVFGADPTMRRKILKKKYPYSHNNNTALIKQISLFDTALVITNTFQ